MAEEVKKLSIKSNCLGHLHHCAELLSALSINLLELRLNFFSMSRSELWLKVLKKLMGRGRLRSLRLYNIGSSVVNWLLLFFIVSGMFHCGPCAQNFSEGLRLALSNPGKTSQSDTKVTSKAFGVENSDEAEHNDESLEFLHSCTESNSEGFIQVQDTSICTTSCHSSVSVLRRDLSKCFSSGLCSDLLKVLKDFKYRGLRDNDDVLMGIERFEEARKSPEVTVISDSREHCDLLDEALGVSSDLLTSRSPARIYPANIKEASMRLMECLSRLHMEENHAGRAIEHLSVSWVSKMLINEEDITEVSMHEALSCFAPAWSSLSSISMELATLKSRDGPTQDCWYFFDTLLSRIKAETLQSVVLYSTVQDWHSVCRFLWETLSVLSGSEYQKNCNTKRTNPMRLLKIYSKPVKKIGVNSFPVENCSELWSESQEKWDGSQQPATMDTKKMGNTDRRSFPGLQELCLKGIIFEGEAAFLPLGRFIKRDYALRHISLQKCSLNKASVDLLLKALNSGVRTSLMCIDLRASLQNVSDSQWQELCQILGRFPYLSYLSLADCHLNKKHITRAQFVNAVKSHETERSLTLDLSTNKLGNSVWDFMVETVQPNSSLKELHIQGTQCQADRGLAALQQIIQNHVFHLPLLRACQYDIQIDSITDALQQISSFVMRCCDIGEDFQAMM